MKRLLVVIACITLTLFAGFSVVRVAAAAGPEWVIVNPGETLTMIAVRYGVSVQALISANNLPNENFVYSGQRLLVPDALMVFSQPAQNQASAQPELPAPQPQQAPSAVYYTVSPGDTLAAIAARYGIPVAAIAQANNLTNWNFVWYGQRLIIPGTSNIQGVNPPAPIPVLAPAEKPVVAAPVAPNAPTDGKWIDIDVTKQTITAYEGNTPLKTVVVSTGLPRTPTVLGTYHINRKYEAIRMTGGTPGIDYYDLPNVPYSMFFFQGYAIHGTYWHSNFGHPMSHGCVNLPTDEAKWFFEWAPMGTTVVSHL